MESLAKRFAHWNPNGGKAISVDDMIRALKDDLNKMVEKEANKMSRLGTGFDMMSAVRQMRGETEGAKDKAEKVAAKQFAENLGKFDNDRYKKIAAGVIKIHEANAIKDIILAIDYVNDLCHWGGSVIVDFLSGKRDPENKENNRIFNEVMETKKHAKSPLEFADKMSSDIRKIVQRSEKDRRAGI